MKTVATDRRVIACCYALSRMQGVDCAKPPIMRVPRVRILQHLRHRLPALDSVDASGPATQEAEAPEDTEEETPVTLRRVSRPRVGFGLCGFVTRSLGCLWRPGSVQIFGFTFCVVA